MSKTLIYIVLLGVLGFGVYYFVFKDREMFSSDEAGFKTRDTGSIHRIFMADKAGSSILLDRTDTGWIINGKYLAIPRVMSGFLLTLAQQDAQYPVPKKMHNMAVTDLATKSTKVELYDEKGEPIKVFYVGGQVDTKGSYMLMEGAEQPYLVQIPGFEGYLSPRYSTDEKAWRDRTVFGVPADRLKMAKITYPHEPLNSFTLWRDTSGTITVEANEELIKGKQLNERRALAYSRFFSGIYAEGYLNGTIGMDSTLGTVPQRVSIEVEDINGKRQQADIYWMPMNKRSKNMLTPDPNVPSEYDADRSYAVINNYKDTVIIQHVSFDKLFRKAWEFYEADRTQQSFAGQ